MQKNFSKHLLRILVLIFIGLPLNYGFKYKSSTKYDYLVSIHTKYGDMKAILFDETPIHKANFIQLAMEAKYDSSIFHRVINNFMIQGGGLIPKYRKAYDSLSFEEKTLAPEFRDNLKHDFGMLAAARTGNPQKRSDISQFYIVQNPNGAHHLDGAYTVFGKIVVGLDVVNKIAQVPVKNTVPVDPIYMTITVEKVKRKDIKKFYGI